MLDYSIPFIESFDLDSEPLPNDCYAYKSGDYQLLLLFNGVKITIEEILKFGSHINLHDRIVNDGETIVVKELDKAVSHFKYNALQKAELEKLIKRKDEFMDGLSYGCISRLYSFIIFLMIRSLFMIM